MKSLVVFSKELADSLIHANKGATAGNGRGRPSKRQSTESTPTGKRPAVPVPVDAIRFDQIGHWPSATSDKKRCRMCNSYIRMKCEKCNLYFCMSDRNCFKDFHVK